MFTVYLARPITGGSYDEVMDYYDAKEKFLHGLGYKTLCPMRGKDYLRFEKHLKASGYTNLPVSTDHAIIERDRWMVGMADIVLVDLTGAKSVSIGCMMELAWAHDRGKHTIIVLEDGNPHRHAFVLEAADIVFETTREADHYLQNLQKGE